MGYIIKPFKRVRFYAPYLLMKQIVSVLSLSQEQHPSDHSSLIFPVICAGLFIHSLTRSVELGVIPCILLTNGLWSAYLSIDLR